MNAEGTGVEAGLPPPDADLTLADRWILHRLPSSHARCGTPSTPTGSTTRHRALTAPLGDYCDWYLELSKISLAEPARRAATVGISRESRAIPPAPPSLHAVPHRGALAGAPVKREAESIMVSAYPDADAAWLTDARSPRWRS